MSPSSQLSGDFDYHLLGNVQWGDDPKETCLWHSHYKTQEGWGFNSVVEHLPTEYKVLGSPLNSKGFKKKKKTKIDLRN